MITLSVGKGLIYVDGDTVELLINTAISDMVSDKVLLEKMKEDQEKEIAQIKLKGDITSIEKAYFSLQKITADLKLHKMKHRI
jgi:F0F1-type ATP synthase epsilon subunit